MKKTQIVAEMIRDISASIANATLIDDTNCKSALFFGEPLTEARWVAQQNGLSERIVKYVAAYNKAK